MKQELIELLNTFDYPVILQGSLGQSEKYPKSFFTFWNDDTSDGSHYDNEAINYVWTFTINFYSSDPALVNTVLLQVKQLFTSNGWIVPGKGYDVPSDESSHTGRSLDVIFIES